MLTKVLANKTLEILKYSKRISLIKEKKGIRVTLSKVGVFFKNWATEVAVFSTNLFDIKISIPFDGLRLNYTKNKRVLL